MDISDITTSTVAAIFRGEMAKLGMRQADLAEETGLPLVSIQRYLSGRRDMPTSALFGIARALCVPLGRVEKELDRVFGECLREAEDAIRSIPKGCAAHPVPPVGLFEEGVTYLSETPGVYRALAPEDGRVVLDANLMAVKLCPKCGGAMPFLAGVIEA